MTEPVFPDVLQVAVVVRDLDAAMHRYRDGYGVGPWHVYEFNSDTVQNEIVDRPPGLVQQPDAVYPPDAES